jgi:hypothetical protein
LKIGDKTFKELVPAYDLSAGDTERPKKFITRVFDLETKTENLLQQVKQIKDFARKGTKDTLYLGEYYRSLLAVQSALTGAVSVDSRDSRFPGEKESKDRLKNQAIDLITKLTTLELDIRRIQKQPSTTDPSKSTDPSTPIPIYFITNTDLRKDGNIKKFLTAKDPYIYFNMETPPRFQVGDSVRIISTNEIGTVQSVTPSSPPEGTTPATPTTYTINIGGTLVPIAEEADLAIQDLSKVFQDGFHINEVYSKIDAINGIACLQLIEHHKHLLTGFKDKTERFVFINDLCRYVFRLEEDTFSYEDAITNPIFQKQLPILSIIHQMHFIGTLLKRMHPLGINASISPDTEDSTAQKESNVNQATIVRDAAVANLERLEADLKEKQTLLQSVETQIKTTVRPTAAKEQWEINIEKQIDDIYNYIEKLKLEREKLDTDLKEKETELKEEQAKPLTFDSNANRPTLVSIATIEEEINIIKNGDHGGRDEIDGIVDIDLKIKIFKTNLDNVLKYYTKDSIPPFATITIPAPPAPPAVAGAPAPPAPVDNDINPITERAVTGGPAIPLKRPVPLAVFKMREIVSEDVTNLTKEVSTAEETRKQAEADLVEKTKEYERVKGTITTRTDKYTVPPFRGEEPIVFVAKYKYTQDFHLNTNMYIDSNGIDTTIQHIYRAIHDKTFASQKLELIQLQLKDPEILPPVGMTEEEAITQPGTVAAGTTGPEPPTESNIADAKAEMDAAIKMRETRDADSIRSKARTIIEDGIDFIQYVGKDSLLADLHKSKDKITVADIDLLSQRSMTSLSPTKTKTESDLDIIKQKFARLKALISEYERKTTKTYS